MLIQLGLLADGWAHTNIVDELESFITPWHTIIFAGLIATIAVVVRAITRRIPETGSWRAAVPRGWNQAAAGVLIFGVSFVGDGIWHTVYGIESGIEALLSPTHLLAFVGGLAIFSAPLAVEWQRFPGRRGSRRELATALTSTVIITFGIAFFSLWVWHVTAAWPVEVFESAVGELGEFAVVSARGWGLSAYIITGMWMVGPILFFLKRWDLPVGAAAAVILIPNLFLLGIQEFESWQRFVPIVVGALVAEWYVAVLRPGPSRRHAARALGAVIPLVIFGGDMVTMAVWLDLSWEPEFVLGAVLAASLVGWALGWLVFPPVESGDLADAQP